MVPRFCTNCGTPVEPGATFCPRCGTRLTPGLPGGIPPPMAPAPAAPYSPPPYAGPPTVPPPAYPGTSVPRAGYPGFPYAPPPMFDYAAMERQKGIDRTKLGVLFLAIGFAVVWVPIIGPIGYLFFFIGAILSILGRHPFGARHARYVVISVVIFILGLVVLGIGLVVASLQYLQFYSSSSTNVAAYASAVRSEVVWGAAGSAVLGISFVLLLHELANPIGRYLLYAGYAATLATGAVLVLLTEAALGIPGLTVADVDAVTNQLVGWRILDGVSSILFAGAYYIAYSRVQRREIPGPPGVTPPVPTAPAPPFAFAPPPATPPATSVTPMVPPDAGPPPPPAAPPNP